MTTGATSDATFHYYIDRWRLIPEGDPIVTRTSRLLPVRWRGVAAMLKVAVEAEEELGNELMAWWDGQGVPLVLAREGKAILLERAQDEGSLAALVRGGRDDEATRTICGVVEKLHLPKSQPIPPLVPLSEWFEELSPAAETYGGILSLSVRPLTSYWRLPAKSASCTGTSITPISLPSASGDGSPLTQRV